MGLHAAIVPLAVLGASQLVSYIRAKGEALGIDAKGGLMERGERIIVLCFALKFPADMLWLLWLIFALSLVTAGQRFVKVWRQADKPPAPLPVEPAAVVLRWRAWREERAGREANRSATWWARAPRAPGRRAAVVSSRAAGAPALAPGAGTNAGWRAGGGSWRNGISRLAMFTRSAGPRATGCLRDGAQAGPGLSWSDPLVFI